MESPACADVSPLVANATADAAAVATTSRLQRQQQQPPQGLREIARHHSVPRRCVTPADPSVSRVIGTHSSVVARWLDPRPPLLPSTNLAALPDGSADQLASRTVNVLLLGLVFVVRRCRC